MSVDESSHDFDSYFKLFIPNSINLITASTNSGKSTFMTNVLKHKNKCFVRDFDHVLIVLCNEKVNSKLYTDLNNDKLIVTTCYINEFIPDEQLHKNQCVIFEDVSQITESILDIINVTCHHADLNSIFFITQNLLKEPRFKTLLSLAHRVIIFFSGIAGNRLSLYISKFYFLNAELKDYFKIIISYAEKHKSIVLIELNEIKSKDKTKYFAIANLDSLFHEKNKLPVLVFPNMSNEREFNSEFNDYTTELEDIDNLPKNAYVLVKTQNVVKKSEKKDKNKTKNHLEDDWKHLNDSILDDIEFALKYKNQQFAKNIAKSILNSKFFDITPDGKSLMIKNQPKTSIPLLDYLNIASRLGFPNEHIDPVYKEITKKLLLSRMPKFFIRNKNLIHVGKSKKQIQFNKKV